MNRKIFIRFVFSSLIAFLMAQVLTGCKKEVQGPVPVTYIMVCCHSADEGTKFLTTDETWDSIHDYRNYDFALSMMRRIKESGINIVGVDFTNPAQWDGQSDVHMPMLENVVKAAKELDMQYFLFCGNTAAWTMKYWNEKAQWIWENLAQEEHYRKYGFGDDRPMMTIFLPGKDFWQQLESTPQEEKDYLERFHIGTCQVNDPITPVQSDGWGYRNMSAGSEDAARFVCPNSGVPPETWKRVGPEEWRNRVKWCLGAKEYAVLGTYDDTCDSNFWGIAEVSGSRKDVHVNDSTRHDPWAYYRIVQEALSDRFR